MKRSVMLFLLVILTEMAFSQDFQRYFEDKTLRLDYIFSGNAEHQSIALDELSTLPKWYGKHRHLAEVPMEGNGQIVVRQHRQQEVIYRYSFSTLFQEWLTYDEAKTTPRSFENVFLIPLPKDTVDVTVELYDNRRNIMTTLTHTINPKDILIRHIGEDNVTPYVTLRKADDPSRCVNIAYVAEGYTAEEMDDFLADAEKATAALLRHEPFKSEEKNLNIVAVKAISADSGTSEPGNGIWRQTALGSHFDTFYSERYLTTLHLKRLHDCLAGTPYEHIIVLVNTSHYGGGGILNSYNLSMTKHNQFEPVVVHEFGHSFAGLADEYAYDFEPLEMYPLDVEPWEANITTLKNFVGKWENLVDKHAKIPTKGKTGVGLYEGAGYRLKGVYRPTYNCRMRANNTPEFCIVCQNAIRKVIHFYTE